MAERAGFEPAVEFDPYDGLANRSFRPLRHLSALTLELYSIIRFLQPEIPVFFIFFQFRPPFFIRIMPFSDNRFDFSSRNSILLEDRIVGNRSV